MLLYTGSRGRLVARLAVIALAPGIAAGAPAATASAAPLAPGPVLGGLTSQGMPVVVIPARSARRLVRVRIALRMKCSSGARYTLGDSADGLPVRPNGTVAGTGVIGPHPPLVRGLDTLDGRYDRAAQTFSGVWRLRLLFSQSGKTDLCDSGPVRIHARL